MVWKRRSNMNSMDLDKMLGSSQDRWEVYSLETDENTVTEFYGLFLTFFALHGCSQIIFSYQGKSLEVYVERSNKRVRIPNKKLYKGFPDLLEIALDRTYSCRVRELSEGAQGEAFHLVNDPITKEPSCVFDSYISRKVIPTGFEYVIDISWRDSRGQR